MILNKDDEILKLAILHLKKYKFRYNKNIIFNEYIIKYPINMCMYICTYNNHEKRLVSIRSGKYKQYIEYLNDIH